MLVLIDENELEASVIEDGELREVTRYEALRIHNLLLDILDKKEEKKAGTPESNVIPWQKVYG